MTQQELNALLDSPISIPVTVMNETFPNNAHFHRLNSIAQNGFTFTGRELLHAIGSKTASLPSSNQAECINAAYLYAHILDFDGQHFGYKTTVDIDSDLQTNRSNEIGIGIGCLIAHKVFNTDWDTLESIVGRGRRFDYISNMLNLDYVYEFKGTKHRGNQRAQIESGLLKKSEMHQRNESYDLELVVSTHLGLSNQEPRIVLADPPFEGYIEEFSEDAKELYRFRHLARLAQFIGNTSLSRFYYNRSLQLYNKRKIKKLDTYSEELMEQRIKKIESQLTVDKTSRFKVNEMNFVGRWVSYWKPEKIRNNKKKFELPYFSNKEKLEVFQGVASNLYESMFSKDMSKDELKFERIEVIDYDGIKYSTYSDGTVMAFRLVK